MLIDRENVVGILIICTQVKHYADVNVRKRHNYDRIRAVKQTFGRHRITAVFHRAVYGGRSPSFTVKNVPYNDRILTYTTEYTNAYYRRLT